uniref:Uncharacterized protein n=1 Tax=Magnetococcus massalia (strain MO-1) TaxID=451514 RepID=A0A1S7LHZ0_MAGMO|nr:Exported protein of unknown function [Candidatus Magnetococcus massalia]
MLFKKWFSLSLAACVITSSSVALAADPSELEARISRLEQALAQIHTVLEAHGLTQRDLNRAAMGGQHLTQVPVQTAPKAQAARDVALNTMGRPSMVAPSKQGPFLSPSALRQFDGSSLSSSHSPHKPQLSKAQRAAIRAKKLAQVKARRAQAKAEAAALDNQEKAYAAEQKVVVENIKVDTERGDLLFGLHNRGEQMVQKVTVAVELLDKQGKALKQMILEPFWATYDQGSDGALAPQERWQRTGDVPFPLPKVEGWAGKVAVKVTKIRFWQ